MFGFESNLGEFKSSLGQLTANDKVVSPGRVGHDVLNCIFPFRFSKIGVWIYSAGCFRFSFFPHNGIRGWLVGGGE